MFIYSRRLLRCQGERILQISSKVTSPHEDQVVWKTEHINVGQLTISLAAMSVGKIFPPINEPLAMMRSSSWPPE